MLTVQISTSLFLLFQLSPLGSGSPIAEQSSLPQNWRNLITNDVFQYYSEKTGTGASKGRFEGDIAGFDLEAMDKNNLSAALAENAILEKDQLWSNGIVPYTISIGSFTPRETNVIMEALKDMMSKTCIQFIERTSEEAFITFVKSGDGCYSYVGRISHQQFVNLEPGCITYLGEIQHEIMHTIGFHHEQSRMDRDSYVRIIWENVREDSQDQFKKYRGNTNGLPYDYNSIMHYGFNAFSVDTFSPTILPNIRASIGNRKGLSPLDVRRINLLYECPDRPLTTSAASVRQTRRSRPPIFSVHIQESTMRSTVDWDAGPNAISSWAVTDSSNSSNDHASEGDQGTESIDKKAQCPSTPNGLRVDNCQSEQDCINSRRGKICCTYCFTGSCNNYCH